MLKFIFLYFPIQFFLIPCWSNISINFILVDTQIFGHVVQYFLLLFSFTIPNESQSWYSDSTLVSPAITLKGINEGYSHHYKEIC